MIAHDTEIQRISFIYDVQISAISYDSQFQMINTDELTTEQVCILKRG